MVSAAFTLLHKDFESMGHNRIQVHFQTNGGFDAMIASFTRWKSRNYILTFIASEIKSPIRDRSPALPRNMPLLPVTQKPLDGMFNGVTAKNRLRNARGADRWRSCLRDADTYGSENDLFSQNKHSRAPFCQRPVRPEDALSRSFAMLWFNL